MPLGILLGYAGYVTGVLQPYIDLELTMYRALDMVGTVAQCAMLILLGRLHETLRAAAATAAPLSAV
jgi:hypothetical protein